MRVRAWLEVYVKRPSPRSLSGTFERLLLRVWRTRLPVITLSSEGAGRIEYDRAHHGIWARSEVGLAGELYGARGPAQVEGRVRIGWLQALGNIRSAHARVDEPSRG